MTDFEIIPDNERPALPVRISPHHTAIEAGKTVFVPLNGRDHRNIRSAAATFAIARGMKAHVRLTERDGVKGLVMWAEPR